MSFRPAIVLICYLVLIGQGCSSTGARQNRTQVNSPGTSPSNSTDPNYKAKAMAPSSGAVSDACVLLEKSEIESVQGAPVQSSSASTQTTGEVFISRCHYAISSGDGSKNLSVHLEVLEKDPKSANADALRVYWEKRLRQGQEQGEAGEDEREARELKTLDGLGEKAFWIGNEKAGVVYVLDKDRIVRVSLGGPGNTKTKIEKSKALAASVLKRLA
jgi:hypothetical protein